LCCEQTRNMMYRILSQLFLGALLFSGVIAQLKIMPLGDSITQFGCWRAYLWQRLEQEGLTKNIKFVGSQQSRTNCSNIQYDTQHEGHAGFQITNIVNQGMAVSWLAATKPDIVMVHLGTNDVNMGKSMPDIMSAFTKLIEQIRQSKPTMKIIVAKIIPLRNNGGKVVELNKQIGAIVPPKTTPTSPITLVDCWTGFDAGPDTKDGVHPSDSGDKKMVKCFHSALVEAIKTSS